MKLYTYLRAMELARVRKHCGIRPLEQYHNLRIGLVRRMERLESQHAEQKSALKELAEIIITAKLKMGRLDRFANLIFAPDVLFEKWLGEEADE